MRRLLASVAAAAVSASCAVLGPAAGTVDLDVLPDVRAGSYAVQTVRTAYSSGDINHVVVKLFTVAGNTETAVKDASNGQLQKDVAAAALTTPIRFGKLFRNTTYRIRAYAYKAAGTASGDQISVDASSSVDVAVASDDRPSLTTLPVQLAGAAFSGEASTTVSVTNGVVATAGPESLTVTSPTP